MRGLTQKGGLFFGNKNQWSVLIPLVAVTVVTQPAAQCHTAPCSSDSDRGADAAVYSACRGASRGRNIIAWHLGGARIFHNRKLISSTKRGTASRSQKRDHSLNALSGCATWGARKRPPHFVGSAACGLEEIRADLSALELGLGCCEKDIYAACGEPRQHGRPTENGIAAREMIDNLQCGNRSGNYGDPPRSLVSGPAKQPPFLNRVR
jgi:hypothetical protein